MFSKIFGRGAAETEEDIRWAEEITGQSSWQASAFDERDVRVLVFQSSSRGKAVLYDSRYADWLEANAQPTQQKRPPPSMGGDVKMLAEMVFGTIPMVFKGTTTKVHMLREPPAIMATKMFAVKTKDYQAHFRQQQQQGSSSNVADSGRPFSALSGGATVRRAHSVGSSAARRDNTLLKVPSLGQIPQKGGSKQRLSAPIQGAVSPTGPNGEGRSRSSSFINLGTTSPIMPRRISNYADETPSGPPSPRALSPTLQRSLISQNAGYKVRRSLRSCSTNIEYGHFRSVADGDTDEEDGDGNSARDRGRGLTFAVAVVFSLSDMDPERRTSRFQEFFFSHFALLEFRVVTLSHALVRTVVAAQTAAARRPSQQTQQGAAGMGTSAEGEWEDAEVPSRTALGAMALQTSAHFVQAVEAFRQGIKALYVLPRLQEAVWLNMVTFPSLHHATCDSLMQELVHLVDTYDTKAKGHFLSSVVTAVLCHHLAWVPTVVPTTDADTDHLDKHATTSLRLQAQSLSYNPLWAQLGDLYGCIGTPPTLARTVVCGPKGVSLRLLYLLSYFIRCSEVFENIEHMTREKEPISCRDDLPHFDPDLMGMSPRLSFGSSLGGSLGTTPPAPSPRVDFPGLSPSHYIPGMPGASFVEDGTDEAGVGRLIEVPMARSQKGRIVPDPSLIPAPPPTQQTGTPRQSKISQQEVRPSQVYRLHTKNFGRSLLAGYWHRYEPDFAAMAVPRFDFKARLCEDLSAAVQHSVLDEPVAGAVAIVADINNCTVQVMSVAGRNPDGTSTPRWGDQPVSMRPWEAARWVIEMMRSLKALWELGLPSEMCVTHIEDQLKAVYLKSRVVAEHAANCLAANEPLEIQDLADDLDLHASDLPLLLAVASTYAPSVTAQLLASRVV